jgi:hypothetical protein
MNPNWLTQNRAHFRKEKRDIFMPEKNIAIEKNAAIAVYDSHSQAERAVKSLQKGGFDMKKLSIIGKGYETEDHVIGYYNAGDRMKEPFGAASGAYSLAPRS